MMRPLEINLAPVITVESPCLVQAGKQRLVTLCLSNHSQQVMRLQVAGHDLPHDYFTIRYPKVLVRNGIEVDFNSLELAPGQTGQLDIEVHPPLEAVPGFQILQLHIKSDPDGGTVLMPLYLDVLPAHDVAVSLEPASQVITHETGTYQIAVANYGAVPRHLTVLARSLETRQKFTYQVEPSEIHLQPYSTLQLTLKVAPKRGGRRVWRRRKQKVAFALGIEDHDGLSLPPDLPQGQLTWSPKTRSRLGWWLGALGTGSAIALFAGAQSIWQPRFAQPQVATLTAEPVDPNQQPNAVRLHWQIKSPEQLERVVLTRLDTGDTRNPQQSISYNFAAGIPEQLQQSDSRGLQQGGCELQTRNQVQILVCTDIVATVPDTKLYRFQLQTYRRQSPSSPTDTKVSEPVSVAFAPIPRILKFFSPTTTYIAAKTVAPPTSTTTKSQQTLAMGTHKGEQPILLNWDIANARQISGVRILNSKGQPQFHSLASGTLPPALAPYCTLTQTLVCRRVPTTAQAPGAYLFKLEVVPRVQTASPQLARLTGPIQIKAAPLTLVTFQINGQTVTDEYIYDPQALGPNPQLELTWQLSGGEQVETIVSTLPGPAPKEGQVTFNPLTQAGRLFLQAKDRQGQVLERVVALKPKPTISVQQTPTPQPDSAPPASAITAAQPRQLDVSIPRSDIGPPPPSPSSNRRSSAPPRQQRPAQQPNQRPQTSVSVTPAQPQRVSNPQSLSEANAVMRGLVKARNQGAIYYNGTTWRKTQDAVILLRRGYSRKEAARRAGLPQWKLDELIKAGGGSYPASQTPSSPNS